MGPLARDPQGKYVHSDADTVYTTATSGQAKWGGMTKEGRDRLQELTDLIAQNRKERPEEIKGIESHILEFGEAKAWQGRDQRAQAPEAQGGGSRS